MWLGSIEEVAASIEEVAWFHKRGPRRGDLVPIEMMARRVDLVPVLAPNSCHEPTPRPEPTPEPTYPS